MENLKICLESTSGMKMNAGQIWEENQIHLKVIKNGRNPSTKHFSTIPISKMNFKAIKHYLLKEECVFMKCDYKILMISCRNKVIELYILPINTVTFHFQIMNSASQFVGTHIVIFKGKISFSCNVAISCFFNK